ncbi:hypothetical protein Tco_0389098 [Tanacetum coccineum]
MDPLFSTFNASTLEQTEIEYAVLEHGASSSHGPQLDPEERIEAQINEWLDEDIWIGAEDEISSDEVVEKEAMERFSFGEKMTYKSHLTSKHQHRESRIKMEILKKWATAMSLAWVAGGGGIGCRWRPALVVTMWVAEGDGRMVMVGGGGDFRHGWMAVGVV